MTLPNRRRIITGDTTHKGTEITVSVGLYPDGRPGEIFAYGYKSGSGHQAERDQTCILWSKLMQKHGFELEDFLPLISMDLDGKPMTMSAAALVFALEIVSPKIMQGE